MERVNAPKTTSFVRRGLVAGAAVCGLLLTGCASSTQPSGVKLAAAEGGIALGSTAAGATLSTSMADKLERIQLAQRVTRLGCIADNGFPEVASLIPKELSTVQDQNDVSAEDVFFASAEDAAANGFGHPVPASPAKLIPHNPAYEAINETCDEQAWQALGDDAEATVLAYHQVHSRLLAAPMNALSTSMPDWTAKLTKCLSEQGHPVSRGGGTWESTSASRSADWKGPTRNAQPLQEPKAWRSSPEHRLTPTSPQQRNPCWPQRSTNAPKPPVSGPNWTRYHSLASRRPKPTTLTQSRS